MQLSDYKPIYETGIEHLKKLMEAREELDIKRDDLDRQIGAVKQVIRDAAARIAENPSLDYPELFPGLPGLMAPISDIGFTGGIRKILFEAKPTWLSPVMVRAKLHHVGYQIKSKNILPSIHTVLKRLEENKEVESKDIEGRTWYRWHPDAQAPQEPTFTIHDVSAALDHVFSKLFDEAPKKPSKSAKKATAAKRKSAARKR